jgi:S1-C subfamily serine protease
MPQTTTEIPQASPSPGDGSNNEIVNYESSQNPNVMDPQVHSLQEFISEGDNTSPLGIEVREARRKLKSGGAADGLLIVDVAHGSPAAKAGLRPYHRTVRDVLEVASVAAALVFPPAVVAVPIFDQVHIGDTYDLIIAVDGSRVMNFLDFEDRMRDVQPGEIVYLSIIRDGVRLQVPVRVPTTLPPPVF